MCLSCSPLREAPCVRDAHGFSPGPETSSRPRAFHREIRRSAGQCDSPARFFKIFSRRARRYSPCPTPLLLLLPQIRASLPPRRQQRGRMRSNTRMLPPCGADCAAARAMSRSRSRSGVSTGCTGLSLPTVVCGYFCAPTASAVRLFRRSPGGSTIYISILP